MENIEQQLVNLSPERRRLVELWLQRERAVAKPAPSNQIARRGAGGPAAVSFAQQRLWLLSQLEPDSPAYNLRSIIRLTGPLDVATLERSLNEIVRRHETLRTSFINEDGQPRQVIAAAQPAPLPLDDLSGLPGAAQDAQVQRLAMAETEQPFDLARGPLWRARLLRLRADEHVLLLTMHHIISDGWSQGVQMRELMALYAAFAQGHPSPLAELPIQYADYATWQRQWFQGPVLQAQLAYWKQQLGGRDHLLELPTDRPRPAMGTHRGAWDYFTLPPDLLERLKELSRREGVTLFMTLLAGFNALLYRYSGQTDVVVGTPVAGRNRSELEGLIGCFVNTLALRTDLSGNPTFHDLLQRVRAVTLGAYSHQELPTEKLIEELQLQRDLTRNPIFQVMLVLQNMPMPALKSQGLTFAPQEVHSTTSILDLSLYVREVERGLLIRAEYNTDMFDQATIQRMLAHLRTLLEGAADNPGLRLAALPLLSDEEQRRLPLVEEVLAEMWADTLGLARVGVHDNVFDLGGDPAKAAQFIVRLRDTFQSKVSVRSLFDARTVASMARLIVAREPRPGHAEKIAQTIRRIRRMPAADRQQVLEQRRRARNAS